MVPHDDGIDERGGDGPRQVDTAAIHGDEDDRALGGRRYLLDQLQLRARQGEDGAIQALALLRHVQPHHQHRHRCRLRRGDGGGELAGVAVGDARALHVGDA